MARCTLVSTFRIILGAGRGEGERVAQQHRRNAGLCKLCCPAPVMYLLNTAPPCDQSTLCPPCPQEMIRGMHSIGLYFSIAVLYRPPFCPENSRMKRVTIICLFSVDNPSIRFSLFSCSGDVRYFFFLFFSRLHESFNEKKRKGQSIEFLSFAFIERYIVPVLL